MAPYQYSTPVNPFIGSIAELLQQPGAIEAKRAELVAAANARAAEIRGQAWGQAARGVGDAVAGGIQSYQAQQRQAPIDAMNKLRLDAAQHEAAGQKALATTMQPTTPQGPGLSPEEAAPSNPYLKKDGDVSVWDVEGLSKAMAAQGFGDLTPQVVKDITSLNDAHRSEATARRQFGQQQQDVLAKGAGVALAMLRDHPNADPALVIGFIGDQMAANGTFPPDKIDATKQQLLSDPSQLQARLTLLAHSGSQAPIKLGKDDVLLNAADPTAPPIASNIVTEPGKGDYTINGQRFKADGTPIGTQIPKETDPVAAARELETARHNKETERIQGLQVGREAAANAETARHNLAMEAANEAAPTLTPDALKLTAHQYAMTGQLPPMGMGKQGAAVRTQIINQAADIYKNLDLPTQVAAYKANQASLTHTQGTLDNLTAFEKAAGKNIDTFISLADKLPDTGVPWLNTPLRLLTDKMVGSEWMPAINAARQIASREVARVVNDPGLKGQLTDNARQGVESMLSGDITVGQLKRVLPVLKNDMANVHSSLSDQLKDIQQRIATPPGGASSTSNVGMIEALDPQGNIHHAPAGTALPAGWKLK